MEYETQEINKVDLLYVWNTLHLTVYPLDASPYTRNLQMAFD